MNDNLFIKIITFADLDKALNDKVIYEKIKDALFNSFLKGEVQADQLAQLVEGEALNQALVELLKTAYNRLLHDLEESEDENLYKDIYKELDDKQLLAKLRASAKDDEFNDALDTALRHARHALFNSVEKDNVEFCETLKAEALSRDNINYYFEVSKVLHWLSFEYCQSSEATQAFIKKHIDSIINSNHPNQTLERLQLFQLAKLLTKPSDEKFNKFLDTSLEHLQAFELLIGHSEPINWGYSSIENIVMDNLNQKNLHQFLKNPTVQPLKIFKKEPSKPVNFFMLLSILWWALMNKNKDPQGLINRVVAAFDENENKKKEYKAYREELSEKMKKYQTIYNSLKDSLALTILDENGEVKNDIDFKAVADDLFALSYLYCFGMSLAKKNPVMDKFFEKFNNLDIVDPVVKGKLEVLAWIYQGSCASLNDAGKDFILQHLDKIMDSHRPEEALKALVLIFFYKLHALKNSNDLIDATLKNPSPEWFFKDLVNRLVSLHPQPHGLKNEKLSSVVDALLVQCSQNSTPNTFEVISKATNIPDQNRPITAWCSFYGCKGHHSLDINANKPDIRVTLDSKS